MREVALVVDEYGNEIFFGETIGECRRYCDEHHITGENGEYIAVGDFDDETAVSYTHLTLPTTSRV